MTEPTPFTLDTPNGPLHGLVDLPEAPGECPAVVICHGFKGFMEWAFFPYLATLLAERGFVAVRVNLSGSGLLPGEDRVSDPGAFRRNTHSRELADLLATLDATGREIAPGRVDLSRLGFLGHSRGGGAAVLAAALPPWRSRLSALVTWAAVASFDRYSAEEKETWRRDGELPVVNSRTGQKLALGVELLDDLERQAAALDILAAASQVTAPWLLVHGEADETVPVAEADRLFAAAGGAAGGPRKKLDLLRVPGGIGGNHTFGARHPFAAPTPALIQALNATQRWFRRHLS
jgi:dienelactone hydrolase